MGVETKKHNSGGHHLVTSGPYEDNLWGHSGGNFMGMYWRTHVEPQT